MPGLYVYGRRWAIASDDFAVPGFACSFSRILWISLLAPALVGLVQIDCPESDEELLLIVRNFVIIAICVYSCTLTLYCLLFWTTIRGTPIEVDKRKSIPWIIRPLLPLIFLETGMTFFGTVLESSTDVNTPHRLDPCKDGMNVPWLLLHIVVIGSWLDLFFSSCCGCLALAMSHKEDEEPGSAFENASRSHGGQRRSRKRCYCFGQEDVSEPDASQSARDQNDEDDYVHIDGRSVADDEDDENQEDEARDQFSYNEFDEEALQPTTNSPREPLDPSAARWRTWCRQLCYIAQLCSCGLFGGLNGTGGPDAFQEFAGILSGFFKSLDLVPSDIVAALFLMRAEQRLQEQAAVESLIRERLNAGHRRSARITHVGRWMWAGRGLILILFFCTSLILPASHQGKLD